MVRWLHLHCFIHMFRVFSSKDTGTYLFTQKLTSRNPGFKCSSPFEDFSARKTRRILSSRTCSLPTKNKSLLVLLSPSSSHAWIFWYRRLSNPSSLKCKAMARRRKLKSPKTQLLLNTSFCFNFWDYFLESTRKGSSMNWQSKWKAPSRKD